MKDLRESWQRTRAHLRRAIDLLPPTASGVARTNEWLEHNELELALDELESAGDAEAVPGAFWAHLHAAAVEMKLREHAERLASRANQDDG